MSGFSSFFFSEQMLLVCKLWNSKVTLSNQGEDAPVRVKYCVHHRTDWRFRRSLGVCVWLELVYAKHDLTLIVCLVLHICM